MKSDQNFFTKSKKFLNDNFWLQPLLLVGGIFAIIFSLNNIPSWFESIGEWLNIGGSTRLTAVEYSDFQDKLEANDDFIVIFVQDGCSACEQFKPRLEKWLELDENNDVTVFKIDLTRENNVYVDATITATKLNTLTSSLNTYFTSISEATITAIGTPTMVRFVDGEIVDTLIGSVTSPAEDLELIEEFVRG